jgi:glycosyltransferase involved in cell wall biosynthesis
MQNRSLPKVSVLVPAFNEEKYIRQTLDALLQQDYPSFEVIVAGNASTDRTSAIVQELIDALPAGSLTVKLVYENRRGTNFARECARQASNGSVIAQIDADCIPGKHWISKGVLSLCNNRRKRVAVTGPYDYFDGNIWMRRFSLLSQQLVYPFINTLVQMTGRAAILIGGNTFIRAEILDRAGGYNTALTFYGDDVDMGKRLSKFGEVAYIPSLTLATSSRRYQANGFWKVNKKYQDYFWNLVWQKESLLQTAETSHPR